MSLRGPLMDTLTNAVGLGYKSSSPLPGTCACCLPQPISTPRRSPPRIPFAFTPVRLSHLCRSQSLALVPLTFSYLSPSCDEPPRHFISVHFSVSCSSLIVFFLTVLSSHRSPSLGLGAFLFLASTLTYFSVFVPVSLLPCTWHLSLSLC